MLGRITKSAVEQLAAGERLWDHGHREVVKGFGVRRQGDAITYYVRFRFQGVQRMCALGSHGHLTPDEARTLAKQKLGEVASGIDPFAEEKKARETARAHETFEKKIEQYLRRRREAMKPRAFRELERHFNDHAKPLHRLRLNEIRKVTVAEVLGGIEENRGPVARNRFRSNLSAFFAWAINEGLIETNPVEGTSKVVENGPRERVLTQGELAEVWTSLGTDDFSNIVRLLILTGQRREEIGGLRWSEVDFDRGLIVFPPERTKNKRLHELPLSSQARAMLERIAGEGVEAICHGSALCIWRRPAGVQRLGLWQGEARRADREATRGGRGEANAEVDVARSKAYHRDRHGGKSRRIAAHC